MKTQSLSTQPWCWWELSHLSTKHFRSFTAKKKKRCSIILNNWSRWGLVLKGKKNKQTTTTTGYNTNGSTQIIQHNLKSPVAPTSHLRLEKPLFTPFFKPLLHCSWQDKGVSAHSVRCVKVVNNVFANHSRDFDHAGRAVRPLCAFCELFLLSS